jgi:predicted restriction endonuclease
MESDNGMKELLQSMMAMNDENQTIKAEPFSEKQEDYPKWRLKQRQLYILAIMAHVLEPEFSTKLPSSETMELDETDPAGKEFAKYRRQNAKAAAVLIAAQESEDVILAFQEANTLLST